MPRPRRPVVNPHEVTRPGYQPPDVPSPTATDPGINIVVNPHEATQPPRPVDTPDRDRDQDRDRDVATSVTEPTSVTSGDSGGDSTTSTTTAQTTAGAGGTEVGVKDRTPGALPRNLQELPDGEYQGNDGRYVTVATDSNGNQHVSIREQHPNGAYYLQEHRVNRPDGSRRVFDWRDAAYGYGEAASDGYFDGARRRDFAAPGQTVNQVAADQQVTQVAAGQGSVSQPDIFTGGHTPDSELTAGTYHDSHDSYNAAVGTFNELVAENNSAAAAFNASAEGEQTAAAAAIINSQSAHLSAVEQRLNSWKENLETFYESSSDAVKAHGVATADRAPFGEQYEHIDSETPAPPIEDRDDYLRVSLDVGRAQKVLNARQETLNAKIAAFNAGEVKDPEVGRQLRLENNQLAAERQYQASVIAHLEGSEGVLSSDDNPYSRQGQAIRAYNLTSDTPISHGGLTGVDTSDEGETRTTYTPEYAAYFGSVVGERVSGDVAVDTAKLDAALAAQDEALENENPGTGRVYTQRVEYDTQGNVIGVEGVGEATTRTVTAGDFYDPGVEGEKALATPRNQFRAGEEVGQADYGGRETIVQFRETLENEGYESAQEVAKDIRNLVDAGHFEEAGRLSGLLNSVNTGINEENTRQQAWLDDNVNSPTTRAMTDILSSYYGAEGPKRFSDAGQTPTRDSGQSGGDR